MVLHEKRTEMKILSATSCNYRAPNPSRHQ